MSPSIVEDGRVANRAASPGSIGRCRAAEPELAVGPTTAIRWKMSSRFRDEIVPEPRAHFNSGAGIFG